MVCHETYKDEDNNWLSPMQVEKLKDKFVQKGKPDKIVRVGPSESMSKSKKNVIDPEFIIENYGADSVRLFILSDSPLRKMYNGLSKEWYLHINSYKSYGFCIMILKIKFQMRDAKSLIKSLMNL